MDSRAEFEAWAVSTMKHFTGGLDLSLAMPTGHGGWTYATKAAESSWRAWQASRQSLDVKPFTWVFTDVNGKASEIAGDPVHRSPQDLRIYTALYTHPASDDVPEGWKLVPVEISHDMEQAGCQAYMDADGPGTLWMHASSMGHAYKAMIDAAPCRPEPAKADEQASVPDKRPSNCREKARQDGGSYPKSGCFSCGNSWLFNGCPHSHKQESAQ